MTQRLIVNVVVPAVRSCHRRCLLTADTWTTAYPGNRPAQKSWCKQMTLWGGETFRIRWNRYRFSKLFMSWANRLFVHLVSGCGWRLNLLNCARCVQRDEALSAFMCCWSGNIWSLSVGSINNAIAISPVNQGQKRPRTNRYRSSRPSLLGGFAKAWHVRLCLCVQCSVSIRVYWQYKQSLIPSFLRVMFSCGSVGVWPPVPEIITRSSEARSPFCPLHLTSYLWLLMY